MRRGLLWGWVVAVGCAGGPEAQSPADAAVVVDAGSVDAGFVPDAGPEDAGPEDAGCAPGTCGVRAGEVTTWIANSGASDDLTLHPDGYLVASESIGEGTFNAPRGRRLLRIDFDGTITELTHDVRSPLGNTVGPDGSLYACEWADPHGSLFKVAPDGVVTEVPDASCSAVFALEDGTLLLTLWSQDRLLRIPPEGGPPEHYVDLVRPVGIDQDASGAVIVSSPDGRVYRLGPDGTPTQLARVEDRGGLLVADLVAAHGGIYATSFSGHHIWRITDDGRAEVFAGTGIRGSDDGPALSAALNAPNGIAASADGRTLYVQELLGALRVIPILD
jgi:sugar lactone lactonase YvrE